MLSVLSRQGDVRFMLYEDSMNQQRLIQFMDRLVRTSNRYYCSGVINSLPASYRNPKINPTLCTANAMLRVVMTHYELMLPLIAALLLRNHLLQGLNGHLNHGVVGLICGEVLHPKAGGSEGTAKGVAVTAHIAVELPGDTHD